MAFIERLFRNTYYWRLAAALQTTHKTNMLCASSNIFHSYVVDLFPLDEICCSSQKKEERQLIQTRETLQMTGFYHRL